MNVLKAVLATLILLGGTAAAGETRQHSIPGPEQNEPPAFFGNQGFVPPAQMPEIEDLDPEDLPPLPQTRSPRRAPQDGQGRPPVAQEPDPDEESSDESYSPAATAANGMRHTTSRVFPRNLITRYPWITIGLFTFTSVAEGPRACSGVVIERRVVMTAGHCVYDAKRRQWHHSFAFEPAYDNGPSFLGTWHGRRGFTTSLWVNGNETYPSYGDIAMVIMHERDGMPIGDATGTMNWTTGRVVEHVHQFGYPDNLDFGQRMQVTAAQTAEHPRIVVPFGAVAFMWGTTQSHGSSGGPIVMDFAENGAGQNFATHRVIGVVSFNNQSQGIQGATILAQQFLNQLQAVCREREGNCYTPR